MNDEQRSTGKNLAQVARNMIFEQTLTGLGVAITTPFLENDAIDFTTLERQIEHLIAGGADFVVSLGSTGEAATLSTKERAEVLRFTVGILAGRIPIVAGCYGSNNTASLVEQLKSHDFSGISAIMSNAPSYVKPRQEGMYAHFMQVAEASPLPILLYNVPSRTASNLLPETVIRLARSSDKFLGLKASSGDIRQIQQVLHARPEGFAVFAGDDELGPALMAAGADGLVSVIGNAFPADAKKLLQGGTVAAQAEALLQPSYKSLFQDGNPAGIKAAMSYLGFGSPRLRLPLVPPGEATKAVIEGQMDRIKGSEKFL